MLWPVQRGLGAGGVQGLAPGIRGPLSKGNKTPVRVVLVRGGQHDWAAVQEQGWLPQVT